MFDLSTTPLIDFFLPSLNQPFTTTILGICGGYCNSHTSPLSHSETLFLANSMKLFSIQLLSPHKKIMAFSNY